MERRQVLTDRTVLHRAGALVGSAIMAVAVVGMPLGVAAKDGDVVRRGSCTARSDWKLKLEPRERPN